MQKIYLLLLLLAISSNNTHLNAQNSSVDEWTKYCGWHYGAGNQPVWGGWARDYLKDGFGLFISDTATFLIDTVELQNSYATLATVGSEIDLLQLDGGLGSARDTTQVIRFMNMILADNGSKWKNIVYQQAKKLTNLPDAENRVYWQIGNEISSPAYSRTIRYWQGQPFFPGNNYDNYIIPYYVENYLAPTVEAIDAASMEVYAQKGKIKICLGSITNAHNPAAQTFLNTLLNYQIVGSNAPSLAGSKVSDLIHIITIHYAVGTANSSNWESLLTDYKAWSGTGRIQGVWSTEEVGINAATSGKGSFAGSIATTRYIEWAIKHQYSAKEVRTNYFGWNNGEVSTTVNYFNTFLYNYLGNTQWVNIDPASTHINTSSTLEQHSFTAAPGNKSALFAFPERIQGQNTTANLNSISLEHAGWGTIQNITAYTYNNTGINTIPVSLNQGIDSTVIVFSTPLFLANTDGLLLFVEGQNTSATSGPNMANQAFSVFPNPASETLFLNMSDNYMTDGGGLLITNTYGQLVRTMDIPVNKQLDISTLPMGEYFIHCINMPQQTIKFIKKR